MSIHFCIIFLVLHNSFLGADVPIVDIVLPVFLLILLGYVLAYFNIVTHEISRSLATYVFWVAAPAIIFLSICAYHDFYSMDKRFCLAYLLGIVFLGLVTYIYFRYRWRDQHSIALIESFSVTIKNTVIIGFPILAQIAGPVAAIPMAATIIIVNCIAAPFLMLMLEFSQHKRNKQVKNGGQLLWLTFRGMMVNPLVLSAFLGVIFWLCHIGLTNSFKQTLTYLGSSFVPCALFAVGVDLKSFKLKSGMAKVLVISLINLLICPLFAIALSHWLRLSAFYSVALVIFSAMPTAKTMYIYISQYRIFEKEMSMIISLTTVISLVTIPAVICLCYYLWPSVFLAH